VIIVLGRKQKYNSKDFAGVDRREMVVPGKEHNGQGVKGQE
jgi:hypothetical protein